MSTGGLVTAIAAGSATITATSEGKSGTATITVREGGFIGPAGGQATAYGGNVTVVVPPGALSSNTALTINAVPSPPPDPKLVSGSAYDFGPSGIQFAQPVSIRVKYNDNQLPVGTSTAQLRVGRLTGATWVGLPGSTVDVATRTVTGQTSNFSTYGVIETATSVVITGSLRVKVGDSYAYTATARTADGTTIVRPVVWTILETAKGSMTTDGVLTPQAIGTITLLAAIDGVIWQGTTTGYDWLDLSSAGSLRVGLDADVAVTNKYGTSAYPTLIISCTSTGYFFLYVLFQNIVTANGAVAFSFDGGTPTGAIWSELGPDYNSIWHPGPSGTTKTFTATIALARIFGFAFGEYNFGAPGITRVTAFRVTALSPRLAPIVAACPSNFPTPPIAVAVDSFATMLRLNEIGLRRAPMPEAYQRQQDGPSQLLVRELNIPSAVRDSQAAMRRPDRVP